MQVNQNFEAMVADFCEVTIRRPNGAIETKVHPKIKSMTEIALKKVNEAMRAAGAGEVIAYKNHQKKVSYKLTDVDMATISTDKITKEMAMGE